MSSADRFMQSHVGVREVPASSGSSCSGTESGPASDEELARLAQRGDLDAFDEIVIRYQERLWSLLFKFCPHQSELEDLVQNAFIKAYNKLDKWRPSGSFKAWLIRVAVNTGYDHYRKRKNEPISMAQRVEKETDLDPLENLAGSGEQPSSHPNADLIEQLLFKLKPEDRLVVTLQYYEEYSLPEIAEQMGWSLSNAKVKSHRARKKLEIILMGSGIGLGD
ncbi:RNA polymerase sigma factor [bacterium]|nr:RNA polymerase sigma factor [bacterium]